MRVKARLASALAVSLITYHLSPGTLGAADEPAPSMMHGLGQVVRGVVVELPATVIDATMTGPPIVGTVVGLLAGTAKALQVTVAGLVEVSQGFNPFGSKR